jgi:hypothetical protein
MKVLEKTEVVELHKEINFLNQLWWRARGIRVEMGAKTHFLRKSSLQYQQDEERRKP